MLKRLLLALLPALSVAFASPAVMAASSFTANVCIEQPNTGEQTNTWGVTVDANMATLDAYTAGILTLGVGGNSNVILGFNCSTVIDQSRNAHFNFTGALTGNINILYPAGRSRMFSVSNNTTGAFTLTVCANNGSGSCAGTTQAVTQGQTHGYVSDGTNVIPRETPSGGGGGSSCSGDINTACSTVTGTHLAAPLPVAQGGTAGSAPGPTTANNIGAAAQANNLSDLTNAAFARGNLGLTALATQPDPLAVPHGGTGLTSVPAHGVMIGAGASSPNTAAPGAAGGCLVSNGAAADPTFQACGSNVPGTLVAGSTNTLSTLAASASSTVAHGLSAVPALTYVYIQNVIAEHGFHAGDRIPVSAGYNFGQTQYFNCSADNTNTYLMTTSTAVSVTISLVDRGTGATFTPTLADWKLVCVPYKIN